MKINGISVQPYNNQKPDKAKAANENQCSFYENLYENLGGRDKKDEDMKTAGSSGTNVHKDAAAGMAANKAYQYNNIHSADGIQKSGKEAAVCETGVKYISYEESDYVDICIQSGYIYMAQANSDTRSVYVEQKMDDGTVRGYDVDIDKLKGDEKDPVMRCAIEAWNKAESKEKQGESAYGEDLSADKALLDFYEFIRYRIKNGEPKYQLGNSEFSIDEWNEFIDGLDSQIQDLRQDMEERVNALKNQALDKQISRNQSGVPYNYLAKDGIIEYNGVVFVCDEEHKAIRLGDTSNPKNCLNIPLSGGGSLIVNRDNIGDLAKAIGMFSPEDVNLIMRAIAQDAKIQQMKHQIDEETSGIDLADKTESEDMEVDDMEVLQIGSEKEKY